MFEFDRARLVRVALAIGKPIERQGLRWALEAEVGVTVVAEIDTLPAAEDALAACQPDVVVWDCELGVSLEDSLASVEDVSQRTPVLAFGPLDENCVVAMLDAGARGYLYHGDDLAHVGEAVRACAQGQTWYSPAVVPFLATGRPGWPRHHWPRRGATEDHALTQRQWDVLRLAAEGQSNKEIAHRLGVQRPTVEEHLSRVYARLGVAGRTGAVRWYVERTRRGGRDDE